jgi:pyruvate dehydrogenase E2 component (dihydrolipoamide acetyltransferase)
VPTDFTLPELGENITSGDVLRVLVKVGDTIKNDQPVIELETDKATIEVPSTVAGPVREIKVKAGDKISVGQAILSVDDESADVPAAAPAAPPEKSGSSAAPEKRAPADRPKEPEPQPEPPAAPVATTPTPEAEPRGDDSEQPAVRGRKVVDIASAARPAEPAQRDLPVAPAAPSVRRMARELGVNINQVRGSGAAGRISIDDVMAHAKRIVTAAETTGGRAAPTEPLPDFTRWGEIERQPMRAVRRKTAAHLAASWAAIPHVTQHDYADITELEELRKRYAKRVEEEGAKLTVTAVAVKVVAAALGVFPQVNVSIDLAADEIIVKKYVNIGLAVDTDRGLLVPVIRDADTKNIVEISVEIARLSEKARNRTISLDEMQGGCFSVSNLGGIGGSFFTPIVNFPEVAILGISRARMEPVYSKETGQFAPRLMLPLSLSYDHRAIDGADGIRFLRWVVEALEQPFLLALQD